MWPNYFREDKSHVGVPQGCILSPLLFAVYTNDIGNGVRNCRFHSFAHDRILYGEGENTDQMISTINIDLE